MYSFIDVIWINLLHMLELFVMYQQERERMLHHLVHVLKTFPTGLRLVLVGNLCVACETPNKHANI
jgi:hypothetical protein